MSESVQGFKRINFFKGFLTTEKDWNDAERYHIDKRRLHNRMLHSPGIVYGYNGDLRVQARVVYCHPQGEDNFYVGLEFRRSFCDWARGVSG